MLNEVCLLITEIFRVNVIYEIRKKIM